MFVATAIISIFTIVERAKGPTATPSQTFYPLLHCPHNIIILFEGIRIMSASLPR